MTLGVDQSWAFGEGERKVKVCVEVGWGNCTLSIIVTLCVCWPITGSQTKSVSERILSFCCVLLRGLVYVSGSGKSKLGTVRCVMSTILVPGILMSARRAND